MAAPRFSPESPTILNAARLCGAKQLNSARLIVGEQELRGAWVNKEDTGWGDDGDNGSDVGFRVHRWGFLGDSRAAGARNIDFRFALSVNGSCEGRINPTPDNVAYTPNMATAYVLDMTCPVGYDSFQWYLQGFTQDGVGNGRRLAMIWVGRRRGSSNWEPHLSDARDFDASNRYAMFPDHWSSENGGNSYPVQPGETVRIFFEFQAEDVAYRSRNDRWEMMFDVVGGLVFLDSREKQLITRDRTGEIKRI